MSQAVPAPRPKKLRIVLVDDEKYMLQLLEACLSEWFTEADLLPFQNGDAAWQELSQTAPDLLITDWQHPGLDGGELLRRLAEKNLPAKILMITAYDSDCVQEFAGSRLKITFLQKPFGVVQFWKAINELIGPCDNPPRIPKILM